ncbi:MAG: hypothetical protein ACLFS5_01925 [Spirochaetaceae bacterium]
MHGVRELVKLKYKEGEGVFVEYTVDRNDNSARDTMTLKTNDAPRRELADALQAMAPHLVEMIEAPREWLASITVRSVTVTHTNDVQGLVITGLRELENSNAPLVINTPHFTRESYNEGGGDDIGIFTSACANALDELETLALRFVDGDRAQQELDFADGTPVGTREAQAALV